ncbi:MAG TPA: polyhydroxyalkanoic acid system family protein [Myxococcaceae bacterium]|nr:polyhydroxyalkanoic acid system family protein [Myxococcaceae bacterium]
MALLKLEVPHPLSKDEARKRVAQLVEYWAKKYGVKVDWSGDKAKLAGKVMGITLDANLEVSDKKVAGEASDPGFLFRDKAKKYLTQKLTESLDPNKKGPVAED